MTEALRLYVGERRSGALSYGWGPRGLSARPLAIAYAQSIDAARERGVPLLQGKPSGSIVGVWDPAGLFCGFVGPDGGLASGIV